MKIKIDISDNEIEWEDNAFLKVVQSNKSLVYIEANKEGLISLAKQLLWLAYNNEDLNIQLWSEKTTDKGYWYGDLEEGSLDLSIVKVEKEGRKSIE